MNRELAQLLMTQLRKLDDPLNTAIALTEQIADP